MNVADQHSFRDAMAHVGAAVNIITTEGPAGRAGFYRQRGMQRNRYPADAAGVPQPLGFGLAGIQRTSGPLRQYPRGRTGRPCRRSLAVKRQWMSALPPPTGKTGATGCPRLKEALVSFDCRIDQRLQVGTHDILFLPGRGYRPPAGTARPDVV